MNGFDIFRINCWLEDIKDNNYEESIKIIIYEYLLSKDNEEQLRNEIYDFIRNTLGIRINYERFVKIIDKENANDLLLESIDDDILIKLSDKALHTYKERTNKYSIYKYTELKVNFWL